MLAMRLRMVDYLMSRIYEAGARHVFFVPGTGCMFLTDALARSKDIKSVSVHHEQAAGMAALTYAKVNQTLGACVVTTGCGGTNAMTACLHAWQDSVPCVFISGQAARHQTVRNSKVPLRQMGRQEADIIALVSPITKYAVMINSPEEIVESIDRAIHEATTGRKGPVWIDVPMDIQNTVFDPDEMHHAVLKQDKAAIEPMVSDIEWVAEELKNAERPILLVGNGIRMGRAIGELKEFMDAYGIPLTYSRLGHDLVDAAHPLSIGMVGMLGASRAGNFALANADFVLVLGCRLSIDTTGYEYEKFARAAKIVVVDIDETEHFKGTVHIDKFIYANVKPFLQKMNAMQPSRDVSAWVQKCLHWKEIFPTCVDAYKTGEKINMYYFTEALSEVLPEGAIVLSDAGNTFFTVSPIIRIRSDKGQRSITSGGQAEMGYALPGSIGAAYAGKGPVVAINGDGSVMMNLQELETIAFNKLNIKVCIMNNNGYSSIRHLQNDAFRNRLIGCDPSSGMSLPNFEKIAQAFGISYLRIEGSEGLPDKIKELFATDGPVLCEVMCVEEQEFLGVSAAMTSKRRLVNRPLEDQAPFLDRKVFLEEMVIPPIDQ